MKRGQRIFIYFLCVLLFVELLFVLNGGLTGNAIAKSFEKSFSSFDEVEKNIKIEDGGISDEVEEKVSDNIEVAEVKETGNFDEVNKAEDSSCYDSDGFNNLLEAGYVEIDSEKFYDYCEENIVYDYYCDPNTKSFSIGNIIRSIGFSIFGGDKPPTTSKKCEDFGEGFVCEDGRCVEVGGEGEDLGLNPNKMDFSLINEKIKEKGLLWTAKENPISQLSEEEFEKRLGLIIIEEDLDLFTRRDKDTRIKSTLSSNDFPDLFDWRDQHGKNYITPIRDQAGCGSCWAFATVATFEGHVNAYYNNPDLDLDLSEQDLVSCFHGTGCGGASISQIESIFSSYLQDEGIATETCFPYAATNINCLNKCSNWQDNAWKTYDYVAVDIMGNLQERTDNIKYTLMNYGPVEVGMEVYDDFRSYGGGIYSATTTLFLGNHAVTIVGWGNNDGLEYWIVKNSWGTNWGEKGYFRILMGDCRIDSRYAFAITESIPPQSENVICTDNDFDGYCYWGIGAKPTENCPLCNDYISDCDDSSSSIFEGCGMVNQTSGSLEIVSNPENAKVYLKDMYSEYWTYVGKTPIILDNVFLGEREIKLTEELCHEEVYKNAIVTENGIETIHANLPRKDLCLEGWPVSTGKPVSTRNTITLKDIDNDGADEVIFATDKLYIFSGNGEKIKEWPLINYDTLGRTPAVGDLDGDGELEIVVTEYYYNESLPKSIMAWHIDGTLVEGFPLTFSEKGDLGQVTLSDLDRDNRDEVITTLTTDVYIKTIVLDLESDGLHIFEDISSGSLVSNYIYLPSGNLDSDKYFEFLLPTEGFQKKLYIFNYNENTRTYEKSHLADIPKELIGSGFSFSISMGDVDNDGELEIFIDDSDYFTKTYSFESDGTLISGWPQNCYGISLADITGDDNLEVICGEDWNIASPFDYDQGSGVHKYDGTMLWRDSSTCRANRESTIGDINGDGLSDIIMIDQCGMIRAWDSEGNQIEGFPIEFSRYGPYTGIGVIAVGDINGDGITDIVTGSPGNSKEVYVFQFGAYNPSALQWPMVAHDPQHTGCYDCILQEEQKYKCLSNQQIGDINGDGNITQEDVELLSEFIYEENNYNGSACCFDVNFDKKINLVDVTKLITIVSGSMESPGRCPLCSDGTPSGKCSGFLYCSEGELVLNRCDKCGCPNGESCEKDGNSWLCKLNTDTGSKTGSGDEELGGGFETASESSGDSEGEIREVLEKIENEKIDETSMNENIIQRFVTGVRKILGDLF